MFRTFFTEKIVDYRAGAGSIWNGSTTLVAAPVSGSVAYKRLLPDLNRLPALSRHQGFGACLFWGGGF